MQLYFDNRIRWQKNVNKTWTRAVEAKLNLKNLLKNCDIWTHKWKFYFKYLFLLKKIVGNKATTFFLLLNTKIILRIFDSRAKQNRLVVKSIPSDRSSLSRSNSRATNSTNQNKMEEKSCLHFTSIKPHISNAVNIHGNKKRRKSKTEHLYCCQNLQH